MLFYRLVRAASIPLFALYFRLEREGAEHVPREGPAILAANHVSYLDPAVLGSSCPRPLSFLMDAGIHARTGLGWFFRGMRAVPVDRRHGVRAAMRVALERLGEGAAVGIFPEGGRSGPGRELPALGGVAVLARRTGAPVVPVGISGTGESMPLGRTLPEPVAVHVAFGAPLDHAALSAQAALEGRAADDAFTRTLMARIAGLTRRPARLDGRVEAGS